MVGLAVIALELRVAVASFANLRAGAWLNAAFHGGVFLLTGGTMGQFFFAGLASSLLLVPEDRQPKARTALLAVVGFAAVAPWLHGLGVAR